MHINVFFIKLFINVLKLRMSRIFGEREQRWKNGNKNDFRYGFVPSPYAVVAYLCVA